MIERKTILDQPELHRSGVLGVRIAKLLIENGVEISCEWHRTSIPPDVNPHEQMAAVNSHLVEMGLPPLLQEDIDTVVACHTLLAERQKTKRP